MNAKSFLVLLILAGVAAAAAGWFITGGYGTTRALGPGAGLPERLLGELAERADEARSITITTPGASLVFRRENRESPFGIEAISGYPADAERVRALVLRLAGLEPVERKTSSAANHGRVGVLDPSSPGLTESMPQPTRITIAGPGGEAIADVIVGPARLGESSRVFVRRADEDQTYLVEQPIDAPTDAMRWIDAGIARVSRDDVSRVEVTLPDGTAYAFVRVTPGGESADPGAAEFEFENLPAGKRLTSQFIGGSIANAIGFLSVEDVAPAAANPGVLPAGTARFIQLDGLIVEVVMGAEGDGDDSPIWARIEARVGEEAAESARVEAGAINGRAAGWVFRLPGFTARQLRRGLDDLLVDDAPAGPTDPAPPTSDALGPGFEPADAPGVLIPPG